MKKLILTTCLILASASAAYADDHDFKAGDWLLRARAVGVLPQENSSIAGGISGGEVNVDNNITPELDLSYFFTPNISAELIAAVSKHNVRTKAGTDVGSAWLLPPTLTLQYHFTNFETFKPYAGAGVNYTHFFDEKGGALNRVQYDDSFGAVLQAGVDVPLGGNWYANADVKKVFINTTAKFAPSGVRANVDIDPWLVGAGLGYRF